jgi:ATP-binding cassette subfamily B protein
MVALLFIMIPRAEASAKRINEVLAMEPEISDPTEVKKPSGKKGYVEFDNVTFSYHGAEKPALTNISFRAQPGQVTAIIGGTGSGKSTLVNLIPRFYDIDDGRILVDGVETRQMLQANLRAKIGFVPQKAVLFAGTINENLRYGKEDASEAEIKHAADVAQASEFIMKMPEGFHSMIAQGGTNVSGGQMQRLSIARALVRKPEIYIFDDTFSALDFKTDAKLRSALKGETRDSTVIIVAQRVSTVIDADQIIVLDDGRIVGLGTHKELMKTCDVYRGIVSSQLSATEIAKENV